MHNYMHSLQVQSFMPILLCVQIQRPLSKINAVSPAYGVILFPVICLLFCLQIQDPANIELVRQMVQAHAYWRLKGLMVDLVIWNEDHGGYRQALQNEIAEFDFTRHYHGCKGSTRRNFYQIS